MFTLATRTAPGRPNEDFALVTADVAIVVDGAGGSDDSCTHPGDWYARQLGGQLLAALADDPRLALAQALGRAVHAVSRLHVYTCDLSSGTIPTATVGMLRVGPESVDVLALGDCAVVVDTEAGPQVTTDLGADTHWVGADPRAAEHALANSYPRGWVRRLAVLSDGATRPGAAAGLTWPAYLDLLDSLGAARLIERLDRIGQDARGAADGDPGADGTGTVVPLDDITIVHAVLA